MAARSLRLQRGDSLLVSAAFFEGGARISVTEPSEVDANGVRMLAAVQYWIPGGAFIELFALSPSTLNVAGITVVEPSLAKSFYRLQLERFFDVYKSRISLRRTEGLPPPNVAVWGANPETAGLTFSILISKLVSQFGCATAVDLNPWSSRSALYSSLPGTIGCAVIRSLHHDVNNAGVCFPVGSHDASTSLETYLSTVDLLRTRVFGRTPVAREGKTEDQEDSEDNLEERTFVFRQAETKEHFGGCIVMLPTRCADAVVSRLGSDILVLALGPHGVFPGVEVVRIEEPSGLVVQETCEGGERTDLFDRHRWFNYFFGFPVPFGRRGASDVMKSGPSSWTGHAAAIPLNSLTQTANYSALTPLTASLAAQTPEVTLVTIELGRVSKYHGPVQELAGAVLFVSSATVMADVPVSAVTGALHVEEAVGADLWTDDSSARLKVTGHAAVLNQLPLHGVTRQAAVLVVVPTLRVPPMRWLPGIEMMAIHHEEA